MQIATQIKIPYPRPLVYATYRDKVLELLPYLPDVQSIQQTSRTEGQGIIKIVNEWQGGGEIPPAARALLSESMLAWTDRARWDEAQYRNDWQIQTHAFTEAVSCLGNNIFLEDGAGTLVISEGDLKIDPNQIQGVPSFMAQMIAGVVEDFLSQKITPNLQQMGLGVSQYLAKQTKN
jgi:hypothetical protein